METITLQAQTPAKEIKKTRVRKPAVKQAPGMPQSFDPREAQRRAAKEKWMKEREHKSKMVTGKFLFNECPGGEIVFNFREFPGDKRVTYKMKHDTIHTIPLGVAMHLNDRCAYAEFQHNLDAGKSVNADSMYIQSKVHRTNFIPLDWSLDVGNFSGKSIEQVTYNNPLDNRYNLDSTGR
jgi:hypothetical protein